MTAPRIRLFSTDLDGTVLGNPEAVWRFTDAWTALPVGQRPLLVYNTGRTVASTQALIAARRLPEPDYIIGSLGTELHDSLYRAGDDFRARFNTAWNAAVVDRIVGATPGISRQPQEFLHAHKSSWYWIRASRDDIAGLASRLRDAGIQAHLVYSCRYFFDVVPASAGKGQPLAWLCRRLGIPLGQVLVAGDTGNDTDMFLLPGIHGIVVRNALPELLAAVLPANVFVAQNEMADGVLEGLRNFGILPPVPSA